MLHQPVVERVDCFGLLAVELQHVAVLGILVGIVEMANRIGLRHGRGHKVAAEGKEGFVVAQDAHHGGQDVYLLRYTVAHTGSNGLARGVVDNDRRAVAAHVGLVFGMVGEVGVVAREHEDGVLEPRLGLRLLEELAYRHVGIAYALVHYEPLLGIYVLVFLGNNVGRVARNGEHRGHKRLRHLANLGAEVLQERLVPDAPVVVEVGIAAEARVGSIVLATVILLEANLV